MEMNGNRKNSRDHDSRKRELIEHGSDQQHLNDGTAEEDSVG
jgi:hypothetical protein